MKILLDACLSLQTKTELQIAGHDVIWAGDWYEDPGDPAILARANQEGRVLVMLDKDFGELGVLHNAPHRGIVRIVNFRAAQQGRACAEFWPVTPRNYRGVASSRRSPAGSEFAATTSSSSSQAEPCEGRR